MYQNIAGQVIVLMPPDFDADMVTVNEEHPIRAEGDSLQVGLIQMAIRKENFILW